MSPRIPDERAGVAAEVADRLRRRGVAVTGGESSDDLADLLSAVERFEAVRISAMLEVSKESVSYEQFSRMTHPGNVPACRLQDWRGR